MEEIEVKDQRSAVVPPSECSAQGHLRWVTFRVPPASRSLWTLTVTMPLFSVLLRPATAHPFPRPTACPPQSPPLTHTHTADPPVPAVEQILERSELGAPIQAVPLLALEGQPSGVGALSCC